MDRATSQRFLTLSARVLLSVAFALMAASATEAAAGAAAGNGNEPPELTSLAPLRIVENDSGSLITISGGSVLKGYSSRRVGDWFEVRIERADGNRVQRGFQGAGFDQGRVIQSGDTVVFLFHLRTGMNAWLTRGTNSIDVVISSKRISETKAAIALTQPSVPTPSFDSDKSVDSKSGATLDQPSPQVPENSSTAKPISSVQNANQSSLAMLAPLQIVEGTSGSRITVGGDRTLRRYSTRSIGQWFEVRISDADATQIQKQFQAGGLKQVRVLQSGTDVVLLFELQPNLTGRVVEGLDNLGVVISRPETNVIVSSPPRLGLQLASFPSVAPPNFSGDFALTLATRVVTIEAPPPKPIVRNVLLPASSNLKPLVFKAQPILLSLPTDISFAFASPRVLLDEEPPPLKPIVGNPPLPPRPNLKSPLMSQTILLNLPTGISFAFAPPRVSIDEAPPPPKTIVTKPPLPQLSHVKLILSAPALTPIPPSEGTFKSTPILVSIDEDAPPPPPVRKALLPPRLKTATVSAPVNVLANISTDSLSSSKPVVTMDEAPPPPRSTDSAKTVEAAAPIAEASAPPTLKNSTNEPAPATSATDVREASSNDSATNADSGNGPVPPAAAPLSFPSGIISSSKGRPREKRLTLNGVFTFGYSRSSGESTALGVPSANVGQQDHANDLGVGLDLNLGTYLLDPRFLKFSLGTSFFLNKGAYDLFSTRQTNKAVTFYADFLPASQYPLRFHYLRQNSNFLERQISSATTGRDSFGFDWFLRKPKLPAINISFDKTNYDSRFLASSGFKSKTRTFNATASHNYFGWDFNGSFTNQAATEGITNLNTNLNEVRLDARRKIGKRSDVYIGSYAERLDFSSVTTQIKQQFSFFDFRADFTSRLTDKLRARASYQFYYNANRDNSSPSLSNSTSATEAEPEKADSPNATAPVPQDASTSFLKGRTSFNAFTGELMYRVLPEITFTGTVNERLISSPDVLFENARNYTDFSGTVSWNRRIKSLDTRASYTQGVSLLGSNLGNSRHIEFHDYSAGVGFGSLKRALITADFNSSVRPDIFQLGGFFRQNFFNVGVETQALRGFHLRATIGANSLDYLTANGRQQFDHTTFSISVDKRPLTFAFSRNTKTGIQDVFLAPIDLSRGLFFVLPVNSLLRDPLLNTSGQSTTALLRVNPRNNLDFEVRYLNDKLFFARTNDVFLKQLDVLVTYRIGKITVTGGAIFYQQVIEGLFSRDRNYYFIRVSRPFNIF